MDMQSNIYKHQEMLQFPPHMQIKLNQAKPAQLRLMTRIAPRPQLLRVAQQNLRLPLRSILAVFTSHAGRVLDTAAVMRYAALSRSMTEGACDVAGEAVYHVCVVGLMRVHS